MLSRRALKAHPMVDRETPMHERSSRTDCAVSCRIGADGRTFPATLTDFNGRGFQLTCERMLMVGAHVELSIPGCVPVAAIVRWSLGGRAGCVFERPVRDDILAMAIDAATRKDLSAAPG